MDNEIKGMLNAIMDEMGRMEERLNSGMDKIENRLEIMQHEINACKLERETMGLLIKI